MSRVSQIRLAAPVRPAAAGPPARAEAAGGDDVLRVKQLESKLSRFSAATVYSLTTLLDLRDLSTGTHGTRLAEWAVQVGELAGLDADELRDLEVACLLHDVGKVGLPDAILEKPGTLTVREFEQIRKHPEYGWAILRLLPGFEQVSLLVLHHHERIDGTGYPAGLAGEEIPLGARIVAVVDAFDAMVSDRPYRAGLSPGEALRRLRADSGSQFDAEIVELFLRVAEEQLGVEAVEWPAARIGTAA
jgi:HD-GYP domain-containing protein (c-di-GMP phosphodiesterase class II)